MISKSLAELNSRADIKEILKGKNVSKIVNTAAKLFNQAKDYNEKGELELAYISFMKFFECFKYIQKSKEYMNNKLFYDRLMGYQQLESINQAEELSNKLQNIYKSSIQSTASQCDNDALIDYSNDLLNNIISHQSSYVDKIFKFQAEFVNIKDIEHLINPLNKRLEWEKNLFILIFKHRLIKLIADAQLLLLPIYLFTKSNIKENLEAYLLDNQEALQHWEKIMKYNNLIIAHDLEDKNSINLILDIIKEKVVNEQRIFIYEGGLQKFVAELCPKIVEMVNENEPDNAILTIPNETPVKTIRPTFAQPLIENENAIFKDLYTNDKDDSVEGSQTLIDNITFYNNINKNNNYCHDNDNNINNFISAASKKSGIYPNTQEIAKYIYQPKATKIFGEDINQSNKPNPHLPEITHLQSIQIDKVRPKIRIVRSERHEKLNENNHRTGRTKDIRDMKFLAKYGVIANSNDSASDFTSTLEDFPNRLANPSYYSPRGHYLNQRPYNIVSRTDSIGEPQYLTAGLPPLLTLQATPQNLFPGYRPPSSHQHQSFMPKRTRSNPDLANMACHALALPQSLNATTDDCDLSADSLSPLSGKRTLNYGERNNIPIGAKQESRLADVRLGRKKNQTNYPIIDRSVKPSLTSTKTLQSMLDLTSSNTEIGEILSDTLEQVSSLNLSSLNSQSSINHNNNNNNNNNSNNNNNNNSYVSRKNSDKTPINLTSSLAYKNYPADLNTLYQQNLNSSLPSSNSNRPNLSSPRNLVIERAGSRNVQNNPVEGRDSYEQEMYLNMNRNFRALSPSSPPIGDIRSYNITNTNSNKNSLHKSQGPSSSSNSSYVARPSANRYYFVGDQAETVQQAPMINMNIENMSAIVPSPKRLQPPTDNYDYASTSIGTASESGTFRGDVSSGPSYESPGEILTVPQKASFLEAAQTRSQTRMTRPAAFFESGSAYAERPNYGLTGILNTGNSCFINSILQCLSFTVPLAEYFVNKSYLRHLHMNKQNKRFNDPQQRSLAAEFAGVCRSLWSAQYPSINPISFSNVVAQYAPSIEMGKQQDSHELLTFLIDGLHDDLNKANAQRSATSVTSSNSSPSVELPEHIQDQINSDLSWDAYKKINDSIIVDLFSGQLKSVVRCRKCKKASITFDTFQGISLPLPTSGKCTLQDCLRTFLSPEPIQDWRCSSCQKTTKASKELFLWKIPPILIVHLMRFKNDGQQRKKIMTTVDFPINGLDLTYYCASNLVEEYVYKILPEYSLYAVSNHYGTLESGHYTAYCRNPLDEKWYQFDDQQVTPIDTSELRTPAAYILFYSCFKPKIPDFIC